MLTKDRPTESELTRQIDQVLGQLRMGQVHEESHARASIAGRKRTTWRGLRPRRRLAQASNAKTGNPQAGSPASGHR